MKKLLLAMLFFASFSLMATDPSVEVTTFTDQRLVDFYETFYSLFQEQMIEGDDNESDEDDRDYDEVFYYFFENFPSNLIVKMEAGSSVPFDFDFDDDLLELEEPAEPLKVTLLRDLYFRVDKDEQTILFSFDLIEWKEDLMTYNFDVSPILNPALKPEFSAEADRFSMEELMDEILEGVEEGVREGMQEALKDYYVIPK